MIKTFSKRDKTLILFLILSLILGTMLHFTYELSGYNKFIGYFSAINESIWEHTKLTVVPVSLFLGIYIFNYSTNLKNIFFSYGISILMALLMVPSLFMLYTEITGSHSLVFDIIIFILAIIIPFFLFYILTKKKQLPVSFEVLGIFISIIIFVMIIYFTYHPLDYWLFK